VGAGLDLEILRLGRGKEGLVLGHAFGKLFVVTKKVRLFEGGHKNPRLQSQLFVEGTGGAFHAANDDEISASWG